MTAGDGGAQRLWARVEYDGTDFFGFQVQAQERTVQGELERALATVTGQVVRVAGAGRTDRGVHARGQVVGFEARWRHSLADLGRALNASLAEDVAVLGIGLAPQGFHPRFSATSRVYRYTLLNQAGRSPLSRRNAWQVTSQVDVAGMARAARCLVGSQDFATFGRPPQGEARNASTVRTLFRAEFEEQRPFIFFEVEANAFLYRMVRSIVGTLVLVGWGQLTEEQFEAALCARDRSQIRQVAPAHGLCLIRVNYARREGVLQ